MSNDDKKRPLNVVPLLPVTPLSTPDWAVPASFVPVKLKSGLARIPFEDELALWGLFEREGLKKLITNPLMRSVYEFIASFIPTEDSFRSIVLDALVSSYSDVKTGDNNYRKVDLERQQEFFSEVALKAYELFELLNSNGEWPTPDTDLYEYLGSSDIMSNLMELLSVSTSSTWPSLYSDFLQKRDPSYGDWEKVEQCRLKEMTWADEFCAEAHKDYRFPPPDIRTEYIAGSEKREWEWSQFLALSLERLDKTSERDCREFIVSKHGNRQTPSRKSYFFLEASHWRSILASLFGSTGRDEDVYKSQSINKIIREHRKASERFM